MLTCYDSFCGLAETGHLIGGTTRETLARFG